MRKAIAWGTLIGLVSGAALLSALRPRRPVNRSGAQLIEALIDASELPTVPAEQTIYSLEALPMIPSDDSLALPFYPEPNRAFVVRLRLQLSGSAVATLRSLGSEELQKFGHTPRLLAGAPPGKILGPCDLVSSASETRIYQRFDHLPEGAAAALLVISGSGVRGGSLQVFDAKMADPDAAKNPIIAGLIRRSPNLTATGTSWRSSLVARGQSRYVFDVALEEDATLELGTGHEPGSRGSAVRFQVVQDDRVLLDEVVGNDRHWHDHRLRLAGASSRKSRIALISDAVDDPAHARGLWSNPRILSPRRYPNILLVTCDAVRPDHLSAYGYQRDTSPALAAAMSFGAHFDRATAQAPRTWESMAALFTGRYPAHNGVRHRGQLLPSDVPHLAQVLSSHGYRTFAGTDLANFPPIYLSRFGEAEIAASSEKISPQQQFKRILQNSADQPFFAWFHLENAHYPLIPKDPLRYQKPGSLRRSFTLEDHAKFPRSGDLSPAEIEEITALYDAAIRDVDEEIAGLLTALNEQGALDHTIVVVTADHGEQIAQHGMALEHFAPYDEVLHVPLMVLWPEHVPPQIRIQSRVQLIDLMPTLLSLAGIPRPPNLDGRDLSDALQGREPADAPAYAELAAKVFVQYRGDEQLLFSPGGAFIQLPNGARSSFADVELYDLKSDPNEHHNLIEQNASRADAALTALKPLLEQWTKFGAPVGSPEIGPAALEALRQAGYLQDRPQTVAKVRQ